MGMHSTFIRLGFFLGGELLRSPPLSHSFLFQKVMLKAAPCIKYELIQAIRREHVQALSVGG